MKSLGQFFTPTAIAEHMVSKIRHVKNARILEPCCGEGVFVKSLCDKGFTNVIACEVDDTLDFMIPKSQIAFGSFLDQNLDPDFDVVIGNPPYVRWRNLPDFLKQELKENELWKKNFNSLCDYLYIFVMRSVELLRDGGDLIFITPSYWFHTTHADKLRDYMTENGSFIEIDDFKEIPIFDKVTSSIVVFHYVKGGKHKNITLNKFQKSCCHQQIDVPHFETGKRWILADSSSVSLVRKFEAQSDITLGDLCDIGNGMVTGLDAAFQIPEDTPLTEDEIEATIPVIKAKCLSRYDYECTIQYIFISEKLTEMEFEDKYPNFRNLLSHYRERLEKRYKYNRDVKYWEWVFLRNYKMFSKPQNRIMVPGKERITSKNFFRFAMSEPCNYPTQDVTSAMLKDNVSLPESQSYLLAYLNSSHVFNWIRFNGIIKGGVVEFSAAPLASIPIRRINFDDSRETALHARIVSLCEEVVQGRLEKMHEIDSAFAELFEFDWSR